MSDATTNDKAGLNHITKGPLSLALWFALPGLLMGIGFRLITEDYIWQNEFFTLVAATFLLVFGATYFLTTRIKDRVRPLIFATGLASFTAGLAWLAQKTYGGVDVEDHIVGVSFFASCIITYIAIPFYRTLVERGEKPTHYPSLFEFAWNLPVVAVASGIFTGAFWLVLTLWVQLFDLIGIDFFEDLFFDDWFSGPATFTAGAIAVGLVRDREGIVLALRSILFAMAKVLTPIFAIATLLFCIAAFATGLDELWTGFSATSIMVAATFLGVTLIAASLGEAGHPKNKLLDWTIRLQSIILPILAAFAVYGIWLRVQEYGLTDERVYAILIVGIASLYGIAYFISALLPKGLPLIRTLNIAIAGCIFALAVLVQTPLLNAHKLAVNSQMKDLMTGKTSVEEFDFGYFQFGAGQYGKKALQRLTADTELENHAAIVKKIDALKDMESEYDYNQNRRGEEATILITELIEEEKLILVNIDRDSFPEGFEAALENYVWQLRQCKNENRRCAIAPISDLPNTQEAMILVNHYDTVIRYVIFTKKEEQWSEYTSFNGRFNKSFEIAKIEAEATFEAFLAGDFDLQPVTVTGLRVGDNISTPQWPN